MPNYLIIFESQENHSGLDHLENIRLKAENTLKIQNSHFKNIISEILNQSIFKFLSFFYNYIQDECSCGIFKVCI